MKYHEVFKGGVPAELYILPEKERLKYEFTIKNGLIAYTIPHTADTYKENSMLLFYGILVLCLLIAFVLFAMTIK